MSAQREREFEAINSLLDMHSQMLVAHRDAIAVVDTKVTVLQSDVQDLRQKVSGLQSEMRAGFSRLERAIENLAGRPGGRGPE